MEVLRVPFGRVDVLGLARDLTSLQQRAVALTAAPGPTPRRVDPGDPRREVHAAAKPTPLCDTASSELGFLVGSWGESAIPI